MGDRSLDAQAVGAQARALLRQGRQEILGPRRHRDDRVLDAGRDEEADASRAAVNEANEHDATADYLITKKGLETVLLYGGYLRWHGSAAQHPLVSEWKANLAWFKHENEEEYKNTYLPEPE